MRVAVFGSWREADRKDWQLRDSDGFRRAADAILILGGAQASRQAGLTAAVSGKRLVCVGSFGGAARTLNELFMQSRSEWGTSLPDSETLGALQNPWSDVLLDDVLTALGADGKPKILIIHGRAHDRDTLKSYLRETLHLPEPTVLVDEKTPSKSIPDKFEELASRVDGAIALCTPDDVGYRSREGLTAGSLQAIASTLRRTAGSPRIR